MRENFHRLATKVSNIAGMPGTFIFVVASIIIWALSGPIFDFSQSWQLVVNTATTIITFLMVFLIQNTQNRDAKAMHLKIDELIRASKSARDSFIDLEDISDEELAMLDSDFRRIHEEKGLPATKMIHNRLTQERHRRSQSNNGA